MKLSRKNFLFTFIPPPLRRNIECFHWRRGEIMTNPVHKSPIEPHLVSYRSLSTVAMRLDSLGEMDQAKAFIIDLVRDLLQWKMSCLLSYSLIWQSNGNIFLISGLVLILNSFFISSLPIANQADYHSISISALPNEFFPDLEIFSPKISICLRQFPPAAPRWASGSDAIG